MKSLTKYLIVFGLAAALPAVAGEQKVCEKTACEAGQKGLKQLTYKIDGAACEAACSSLDKALTSLEGVSKAESCSQSRLTRISYDPTKIKPVKILAALKKSGVKVAGQRVELPVQGLTCSACAASVDRALTKLDGVLKGSTCHESRKATVLFDPEKVKESDLVAAINATGFKVGR